MGYEQDIDMSIRGRPLVTGHPPKRLLMVKT
jgi:hypothetical protein